MEQQQLAAVLQNVLWTFYRVCFGEGFDGVLIRVSFCMYIRDILVYCYNTKKEHHSFCWVFDRGSNRFFDEGSVLYGGNPVPGAQMLSAGMHEVNTCEVWGAKRLGERRCSNTLIYIRDIYKTKPLSKLRQNLRQNTLHKTLRNTTNTL